MIRQRCRWCRREALPYGTVGKKSRPPPADLCSMCVFRAIAKLAVAIQQGDVEALGFKPPTEQERLKEILPTHARRRQLRQRARRSIEDAPGTTDTGQTTLESCPESVVAQLPAC